MQKIEFKDLPDTTTPITAYNLNLLQDNVEEGINGVVESGSNENGNYIKFYDGTLICYNTQVFSDVACSYSWGNVYTNNNDKRTFNDFPVNFIASPNVSLKVDTGTSDCWLMSAFQAGGPTTTNVGGWQICRGAIGSSLDVTISYIAIGKWK